MKILNLTLHQKWFDQIASGYKKIEYRKIKPYWESRLDGKTFDEVHFRNGYQANAPFMRVQLKKIVKNTHYNIYLGKVLEIKNY